MRSGLGTALTVLVVFLGVLYGGVAAAQSDSDCLFCHADAEMFEDLPHPERLVVDAEALAETMHGEMGLGCTDCHQDLADADDYPHGAELEPAACGTCHEDVAETYDGSVHGYAVARGNPKAPTCSACHGIHDIVSPADDRSPAHHQNLSNTCAACHGTSGLLTNEIVKLARPFESYAASVHGHGTTEGEDVAASCTDCHGVHDLRGNGDPKSKISRANISSTCGSCHADVAAEYDASIHGLALQAGVSDSPTCVDCHGEHLILGSDDPHSDTYARKQATETCGHCHADPAIIAKYNLRSGVVGSYVDSYHGWATSADDTSSASCVSCHTAHAVMPESHPDSTIHANNLLATCRSCHPGANDKFAASYTHEALSVTDNPVHKWIRIAYIGMIIGVIGGMLLHNLIIINYYTMERRRRREAKTYVGRMDSAQVWQHMLLTVSFAGLVVTGFALRYPDAWWVHYLSVLGMSEPVRSNLHRILGGALVAVSLWHVWYVFLNRQGKHDIRAMLPVLGDVGEFFQNMRFYLWRRKEHVDFGQYDYTQKAEYWALVWGTFVMVATGVVLWFPAYAVKLLPSWIVIAAQTVHFYEAWLATLAIVVWHMFFVVLHPEVYPMSWIWITGEMPSEEARKHHPRWYAEEQARQAAAERERPGQPEETSRPATGRVGG